MTKRLTNKLIAFLATMLFLCVICLVAFCLCKPPNTQSSRFYFVYAHKTKSLSMAENYAEEIEKRGGAGNIFTAGENKFVLLNVYNSREESEKVCDKNRDSYADCGIIEFNCEIKNLKNKKVQNYCKTLVELCQNLCNYAISYDLNEMTISEISRKIIHYRQNILSFKDDLNSADSNSSIVASANLVVSYIDSFCHNVFVSSMPGVHIKKLAIWCVTELYQIKNLL